MYFSPCYRFNFLSFCQGLYLVLSYLGRVLLGIHRFCLVGFSIFFFFFYKNRFRLINFFNWPHTRWKQLKKHGLFVSWAFRRVTASQPKRLKKFPVEKSHTAVSIQLWLKRLIQIEYGLNQLFLTLHQILRAYMQASQKLSVTCCRLKEEQFS